MKISIIHLSDIHLKIANNTINDKREALFNAIRNEIENSYIFIVVTGDIAYSGKKEEYREASDLFLFLEENITKYLEKAKIEFIFCPGNHDCDFDKNSSIRDTIIKSSISEQNNIDKEYVELCTSVQDEYFEFINDFKSSNNIDTTFSSKLLSKYDYKIGKHNISFNSFNSAWMSKINEAQGEIVFPSHLLDISNILEKKNGLTFSILHHPFHWLTHNSLRVFKENLSSISDIILTGHEHSVSITKSKDIVNHNSSEHIEGGTLQNTYDEFESGFNIIEINLDTTEEIIKTFKWHDTYYEKTIRDNLKVSINNNCSFQFKDSYRKQLSSLGLKISHPRKDNIILDDLFIYLDLEILKKDSDLNGSFEISSSKLTQKKDIGYNILYGSDNSGKSTLAKKLQISYRERGLLSIIINGKNIKRNDVTKERLNQVIRRAFKAQYGKKRNNLDLFDQYDINKIVLIIDDFHNVNLNSNFKGDVVEKLSDKYKNIVILTNDILQLEATNESFLASSLENYEHYLILELGFRLRDKMIKQWVSLGQESEIEQKELMEKTRSIADAISKTIGFNMVPSSPIYILTLLQATEMNETSLDKSSYGHYYHFLILQYLNGDGFMEHKDITATINFASALAFDFFERKSHDISDSKLAKFGVDFKKEFDFEPKFNIGQKLITSGILVTYEDKYKFSHKYLYYYFIGYYFSQNVEDKNIVNSIQKMTQRLHKTEFANIIMFTLHFSPKYTIINMINVEAEKIFEDIKEFAFENDEIIKINSSIEGDTFQKLKQKTIEQDRDEKLNKEDKNQRTKKLIEDKSIDIDYDDEIQLNLYKKINLAYKLVEMLGEVIKNYPGGIKKDVKFKMIQNTYSTGLRALKKIISIFEDHHELAVEEISDVILKKNLATKDKINEAACGYIFGLVSSISIGTVKRISKALASKDLVHIYERISDETPDNIAYTLIKHAIKLDFNGGLQNPKNIYELYKILNEENNFLATNILKRLVLEHLYMYEISFDKRTSICKKLDIGLDNSKKQMIKHNK